MWECRTVLSIGVNSKLISQPSLPIVCPHLQDEAGFTPTSSHHCERQRERGDKEDSSRACRGRTAQLIAGCLIHAAWCVFQTIPTIQTLTAIPLSYAYAALLVRGGRRKRKVINYQQLNWYRGARDHGWMSTPGKWIHVRPVNLGKSPVLWAISDG